MDEEKKNSEINKNDGSSYVPTNNEEQPVTQMSRDDLINNLMRDVGIPDTELNNKAFHPVSDTIKDILHDYHLSTDMAFIEKIASLKFSKKGEQMTVDDVPRELKDAAFLPVNTLSDIALRQDIDMLISQIPEWATAVTLARDSICEADCATGKIARTIKFDTEKFNSEDEHASVISKIEAVEKRLELDSKIKYNVRDALEYGEGGYEYTVPYAKVFSDLYKYRINNKSANDNRQFFDTSTSLIGYGGYGEQVVERSLSDTIIQEQEQLKKKNKKQSIGLFTEQEIMQFNPQYHQKPDETMSPEEQKICKSKDEQFDAFLEQVSDNIRFIDGDVALPVIEESAFDLEAAYHTKYKNIHDKDIHKVKTFFESVMDTGFENDETMCGSVPVEFQNVKGIYMRNLPSTKMIPIRIDRTIVGFYYISDKTRPDSQGERKNSALSGYTLRSPSIAQDTFSPDQMFYEKLASKIINNFDLKFMRDNVALHKQIVTILEAHNFNDALLRFVFIPAEYVINLSINKDGTGRGHSMLEAGLPVARMYMFIKLYSLLFQINNSQIRVYNMRTSGIDKNIKQFAQDNMRKFMERRVTPNDIFNYRSSMTKVSGCSEMLMPVGPSGTPPLTVEAIPAAEAPINNELMEMLKNEAINSQPVPSAMIQGAMSELDFAKEVELANTRLNSFVSSCKVDLNPDITRYYKRILKWETDIDEEILSSLEYILKLPTVKAGAITAELINNFNSTADAVLPMLLTPQERGDNNDTPLARETKKLLFSTMVPDLDMDKLESFVIIARDKVNRYKLDQANDKENLLDGQSENNEG